MIMRYVYQLNGIGFVYSSFDKAHKALCKVANEDPNTFFATKTKLNTLGDKPPFCKLETQFYTEHCGSILIYPGGISIYKRPLL